MRGWNGVITLTVFSLVAIRFVSSNSGPNDLDRNNDTKSKVPKPFPPGSLMTGRTDQGKLDKDSVKPIAKKPKILKGKDDSNEDDEYYDDSDEPKQSKQAKKQKKHGKEKKHPGAPSSLAQKMIRAQYDAIPPKLEQVLPVPGLYLIPHHHFHSGGHDANGTGHPGSSKYPHHQPSHIEDPIQKRRLHRLQEKLRKNEPLKDLEEPNGEHVSAEEMKNGRDPGDTGDDMANMEPVNTHFGQGTNSFKPDGNSIRSIVGNDGGSVTRTINGPASDETDVEIEPPEPPPPEEPLPQPSTSPSPAISEINFDMAQYGSRSLGDKGGGGSKGGRAAAKPGKGTKKPGKEPPKTTTPVPTTTTTLPALLTATPPPAKKGMSEAERQEIADSYGTYKPWSQYSNSQRIDTPWQGKFSEGESIDFDGEARANSLDKKLFKPLRHKRPSDMAPRPAIQRVEDAMKQRAEESIREQKKQEKEKVTLFSAEAPDSSGNSGSRGLAGSANKTRFYELHHEPEPQEGAHDSHHEHHNQTETTKAPEIVAAVQTQNGTEVQHSEHTFHKMKFKDPLEEARYLNQLHGWHNGNSTDADAKSENSTVGKKGRRKKKHRKGQVNIENGTNSSQPEGNQHGRQGLSPQSNVTQLHHDLGHIQTTEKPTTTTSATTTVSTSTVPAAAAPKIATSATASPSVARTYSGKVAHKAKNMKIESRSLVHPPLPSHPHPHLLPHLPPHPAAHPAVHPPPHYPVHPPSHHTVHPPPHHPVHPPPHHPVHPPSHPPPYPTVHPAAHLIPHLKKAKKNRPPGLKGSKPKKGQGSKRKNKGKKLGPKNTHDEHGNHEEINFDQELEDVQDVHDHDDPV